MTQPGGRRPLVRLPALARKGAWAAVLFCGAWFVIEYSGIPARDTADFGAYYAGAQALGSGADPYQYFVQHCVAPPYCGYAYPPLLAELVRPLTTLPLHQAARLWLVLNLLFLGAAVEVIRRAVGPALGPGRWSLLVVAWLLWLPMYQGLYYLQVVVLLLLLQALAAWAFVRGRDGMAGGLVGLAALLRVAPAAMVPVFARSRRQLARPWGLVALAAVVAGGSLLMLAQTRLYLDEVLPRQAGGNAILENLSLPAVIDRAAGTMTGRPQHLAGLSLAAVALLVAVTWVLSWGRDGFAGRAAGFAAWGAIVPIISPVTWTYHLTSELVSYALLLPSLRRRTMATRLALVSYPLMWVGPRVDELVARIPGVAPRTGLGGVPWLVLTSLNLFGMLALWVSALLVLRMLGKREREPEPDRAEEPDGGHLPSRPAAQGASLTSPAPNAGSRSSSPG